MKRFYPLVFLTVIGFCFLASPVFATHNMGKDLQYICLGTSGGNIQFKVIVRFYRNCWDNQTQGPAVSAPSSISLQVSALNCTLSQTSYTLNPDPSASPPDGTEVSQLCPAQLPYSGCSWSSAGNPPYPGVQIYTYSGIVTVPSGCTQVTFGTTDCCRNSSINNISNPGSEELSIKATANTSIDPQTGQPYCNNSVAFTNQPVPFFCLGSNVTFNHGGVDVDGDSLVYSLINPMDGGSLPYNNIPFMGGYSVSCPISTSPPNTFQFNTQTGQMQFVPALQEQDVLAIRVDEYRNGVPIGSAMRDIQVVIMPCTVDIPVENPLTNVQNANQVDSFLLQVCPGTPAQFDVQFTDPGNHDLTLSSNINGTPSALPGATMTQVGTGDTVIARINWIPASSDTGCHNFTLTAENDDCPINGAHTRVYSICVFAEVHLSAAGPTFCGTPVKLTATGGTNFTWSPATGPNAVSDPNSYTPTVMPVSDTKYYFSSDCGTDSVTVHAAPPFTYDAGPGGSICQNGEVHLNATVDNLYAPYHFKWVPSTGLLDPVANVPNDTIPNPVASPNTTTTYVLSVTGSNGCTNVDSVTVNVSGTGPNIVAQAQPTSVCPGDPVNLNVIATPQTCGLANTACVGHIVQAQVGTGTGLTPVGSPTGLPTAYGHYAKSTRHQFLYLSSELLPLLGAGGTIDSIAFYMDDVSGILDTVKNFEIKMGCTQSTSLTGWEPNMVTVFSPKSVPLGVVDGWVTHKLDFPYNWDGTSNLVIDVCTDNTTSPQQLNKKMQMTPTAFQSVYYTKMNTNACGNTGSPLGSVNRPNCRFTVCITDVAGLPISWTPSTGPNAPTPTNIINPVAHPETPTVYTVDITAANGCHSQDFVYVTTDTSVRVDAHPDDIFFCGPMQVQLTTTVFGNPLPGNNFTYDWTDLSTNTSVGTGASITVNLTSATDYLVSLSGGACTVHDTVHIRTGTSMPVNLVIDSISCYGSSDAVIHAQAVGGTLPINYTWSTNVTGTTDSIANLAPGTYSVTTSDAYSCTGSATTAISEPPQLSYSANFTNILCNGDSNGTIAVTPTGGTPAYHYNWNPAQPDAATATGLPAGPYSITVTDSRGCSVSLSGPINEPTAITVAIAKTNATCETSLDGTAIATVNGGITPYTYAWDGITGDTSISTLDDSTHTLVVTDGNNCTVSTTFVIDTVYKLHISVTSTGALCFGGNDGTAIVTPLNGTAAFTYLWTPSGQTTAAATALPAGTYNVSVTDSKHCVASDSTIVTQPTQISLSLTHTDPLCTGISNGTADVSATGGTGSYTYDWAYLPGGPDNSSLTGIPAGVYTITATDANNCTAQDSVTLTNPPSMDVQVSKNEITCANAMDGSVEISVSGGTQPITFAWSNGSSAAAISNLAPGNYIVTVADNNGCDTALTVSFTAPPLISIATLNIDSVSCPGYTDGAIQVSGTGGTPGTPAPYEYSIDGVSFQVSQNFALLPAGSYHLIIRDMQGCTMDTTLIVYEPVKPVLTILPQDSTIKLGQSLTLVSSLSDYTAADINFYSWSPTTGLACFDCATVLAAPYTATTYNLTVNYLAGCSVSQTVAVYVGNGEDFYIPNAFTPNGDGNNDVFDIYGFGMSKVNLRVFNRWGEKVYDSQNQWGGWDGTYKGQMQYPGVYTYEVEGVYLNGKTRFRKGTITLIR